ncbi:MAG: tRNA guanosine(34) transglycosylase Tgt [Chlamydiales bacterium]
MNFEILHKSKKSSARVGRIYTPHGIIDTPNFVAVGTNGTLKALNNEMIDQMGVQLMFCNTYHLLLQPGTGIIKKAGGLHKFIQRKQPLITDSGGFQIFSLNAQAMHNEIKSHRHTQEKGGVLKINEEGVTFRSYRNGEKILLTPESSIEAQKDLGADIIIPLDELPPHSIDHDNLKKSLARTHRWEMRSLNTHLANPQNQAIYGVIHGGIDFELRKLSIKTLTELPFDGFAIGGSIGKNRQEMSDLIEYICPLLPEEKPNHLLGIGDVPSIRRLIPFGIDTFDSSYPTRAARHGLLLTQSGGLKIHQRHYATSFQPIETDCACSTCSIHSLAYLHHLFKAREVIFLNLATIHNLHFMIKMMMICRKEILEDKI